MWIAVPLVLALARGLYEAEAATATQPLETNDRYPNMCVLEQENLMLHIEEEAPIPGECGIRTCYSRGGSMFLSYEGCGAAHFNVPDNCRLVKDLTKPYPECCDPDIICDDSANEISQRRSDQVDEQPDPLDRISAVERISRFRMAQFVP